MVMDELLMLYCNRKKTLSSLWEKVSREAQPRGARRTEAAQPSSPSAVLDRGANPQQGWCHRRDLRDLWRECGEAQGQALCCRAPTSGGGGQSPQALAQMLYQDQDALQPPNTPSLPQHPHAATINLSPTCGPVAPRADPMPRLTRAVQRDTCHPGWDDVGFGQLQQTRTHQLVASIHCPGAALGPHQ